MKAPFFKSMFVKEYDSYKNKTVFYLMKNWLLKHDKVLFNCLNNGFLEKIKFIEEELPKAPPVRQFEYVNSDYLEITTLLKLNPVHSKIIFESIDKIDKNYEANEIINLFSLNHYPALEAYFSIFDFHRNNLKKEHFQDRSTAADIISTTLTLLIQFDGQEKELSEEFYYEDGQDVVGLASYLIFIGNYIKIYKRLKLIRKSLLEEHPEFKISKNKIQQEKRIINIQEDLINKLPKEWKDKPYAVYYYQKINNSFPRECKSSLLKEQLERRKFEQRLIPANNEEKVKLIEEEQQRILELITSSEFETSIAMFTLTMENFFRNLNLEFELALLTKENDEYFHSKEEIKNSEEVIKKVEFLEGFLEAPTDFLKPDVVNSSNVMDGLNYLDKYFIKPRINFFLTLKSLFDRKEFLDDLLAQYKPKNISKQEQRVPDKSSEKWYTNDTPFELPPNGFIKIDLNLSSLQERKFLSFLYRENNATETPFLSEKEVKELFKYGLVISDTPNKTLYKLDLNSKKKPANIIFYCFSTLFKIYSKNRNAKGQLALFLKNNFVNFNDLELYYIKKEMRSDRKPKLLEFEINKYL